MQMPRYRRQRSILVKIQYTVSVVISSNSRLIISGRTLLRCSQKDLSWIMNGLDILKSRDFRRRRCSNRSYSDSR